MLVLIRSDSARIMYSAVRNLDMRMADPIPTFSHLITAIRDRHPEFGYVHLVEPRISGDGDSHAGHPHDPESNDIFRALWGPRPYLTAGGYNRSSAIKTAEEKGGLIVFGRHFLSNVSTHTLFCSCSAMRTAGRAAAIRRDWKNLS